MTTNSQIILDGVLKQRQTETDPDADPSTFFEFFTAQQILKDFDLSYDEIEYGLIGVGGDGGVDSIYLLVNGDLVQEDSDYSHLRKDIVIDLIVIQSKTHSGFQETPVERFITVSRDLFDLSKGAELSSVHPADTIATENSGTRGQSNWAQSNQAALLQASLPLNSLPEMVGPPGTGVALDQESTWRPARLYGAQTSNRDGRLGSPLTG